MIVAQPGSMSPLRRRLGTWVRPPLPRGLLARASRWEELKRWERRELGQELRRLGLSYSEIAEVIPVAKGYNGTATIRVARSGDMLYRIFGWIDAVTEGSSGLR